MCICIYSIMKLKDVIIQELQSSPKSMDELIKATGKTYKNIQARISELRQEGYNIELKPVEVQKYTLLERDNSLKIIEYLKTNNLFKYNISLSKLSNELSIPIEDVKSAIAKLMAHDRYNIIQFDTDTIKVVGKY